MLRPIAFAAVASLALAACTPKTAEGTRAASEDVRVLNFSENYQSVYRRMVSASRECFETNLITASMNVRSDLYTELDRGEISYELQGVAYKQVYAVADIIKDGEGTRVEIRAAPATRRYADAVEKYATEGC